MKNYRLTLLFALTAVIFIAAATIIGYRAFEDLATRNLMRIAEENTVRDALHIQSMMRSGDSMDGMSSAMADHGADGMPGMQEPGMKDMPTAAEMGGGDVMPGMPQPAMQDMSPTAEGVDGGMAEMQHPVPLTLGRLAGPKGLPSTYRMMVDGLNIVKFSLVDPSGTVVWSTESGYEGTGKGGSPAFERVLAGEPSSDLLRAYDVIQANGTSQRLDVVETRMPVRETPSGEVIGVMELVRGVGHDVAPPGRRREVSGAVDNGGHHGRALHRAHGVHGDGRDAHEPVQ